MSRTSLFLTEAEHTVSDLLAARKQHEKSLFVVLFITLLGFAPLFLMLGTKIGFSLLLALVGILALTLAIVRWPIVGLYVVAACAFLIEQEALATPIFTDHLYVFYWPPQFEGFFERPIGVLILFIFGAWLLHRLLKRERLLRRGALWLPFALYMLCVAGGILYGLATGGNLKIIVVELRPFWYMFTSYLLAYNFVTRKGHIRAFFWLAIICAGIKSLQGLYVYLIVNQGSMVGHDTIMSHEEFFLCRPALTHHHLQPAPPLSSTINRGTLYSTCCDYRNGCQSTTYRLYCSFGRGRCCLGAGIPGQTPGTW